MKLPKPREFRLDDNHTIRLRVSKWFPEMVLMTALLASAGIYLYGDSINRSSSIDTSTNFKVSKKTKFKPETQSVEKIIPSHSVIVNPKIVAARMQSKNMDIRIDSVNITNNTAAVTYHIVNLRNQQTSGSTWTTGVGTTGTTETPVTWSARYFTVKQASIVLSPGEKKELRIFVRDDVAKATNSYLIRF